MHYRRLKKESALVTKTKTRKSRQIKISLLGGAMKLTKHVIDKLCSYYNAAIRKTVHICKGDAAGHLVVLFPHVCQGCPTAWSLFSWSRVLVLYANSQGKELEPHCTKKLYLSKISYEHCWKSAFWTQPESR